MMLLLTGTNIDLGSFRLPIAYLSWIAQKYKRENNELKKNLQNILLEFPSNKH